MDLGTWMPIFWAQVTPVDGSSGAAPPAPIPVSPAVRLAALVFRRWFGGLTLSSPSPVPDHFGALAWGIGLGALLLVCLLVQGPGPCLRQLLDVGGHLKLASGAIGRLGRSGRLVATLMGATVLWWTGYQAIGHHRAERLDDLAVLRGSKSLRELAVEHGTLSALTPLRDPCGLGDNIPLLVAAVILLFKLSADRWGSGVDRLDAVPRPRLSAWTTPCWMGMGLYGIYRAANLVADPDGLPFPGRLVVDSAIVPALMALSDGLLLAWVVAELRQGAPGGEESGRTPAGFIGTVPAAILGCVAALPARYASVTLMLTVGNFPKLAVPWVRTFIAGRGLAGLQAGSLLFLGLAGCAAWTSGSVLGSFALYGRLIRREGGRLVAAVALGGLGVGLASAVSYFLVLALPPEPWVVSAADAYAHYGSFLVGLATLAALVDLAGRVAEGD